MGQLKHIPERITEKRPKVYFSCHKDDFKPFFEEISSEILKGRSCSVWYDEDIDGERDKNFYFDLSQMTLFVMPITTRLLTTKNRALDEELAFAVEHHIPILPLMQEDGLEELFNKKFGNLQFLTKHSTDRTEISYEEKLNKFLSSVLLDDKTIKRIQAEFDGYIFLSYRKKDRIHAQRLMQLIHKNDFCRDIAIWYDEFLTPGENFNENIKKALDKSELFVLAVTPSLLEPRIDENGNKCKNYIEEHEYPMAYNAHKAILPTELVATDKTVLAAKYANIPDCVNADDEDKLSTALSSQLKGITKPENDTNPEHNYLIGLAYLDGIDVEVNHSRARKMIEFSANADHFDAIDKLIEMYTNGRGVERSYETAIEWREKKIELLKARYDENPNENNATSLFREIVECGDEYRALGKLSEAKQKYESAQELCESFVNPSSNTLRNLSISYERLGDIYKAEGNIAKAKELYEKALAIRERLADETGTVQARSDLSISYNRLGDIYKAEGNIAKAKELYEKALAIREQLADETDTVQARRDLSISYERLGDIYKAEGNITKAKELYEKELAIFEQLADETDTVEARRNLSISYNRLGNIYIAEGNIQKAKELYEKDLAISEQLAKETGTIQARSDLSISYNKLGDIYIAEGNTTKAKELYEKDLAISERLADETGTVQARRDLAICYGKLGILYEDEGNLPKAKKLSEKALPIFEQLADETGTVQARSDLSIGYERLGDIYKAEGNITKAKELYEKKLAISEQLANETGTVGARRDLSISYEKLGDIYKAEGNITKAKELYEKALAISEQLANETGTAQAWHDLAISYYKVAFISQGFERREYLQKALDILNALCAQCPEVEIYRQHRDIIQNELDSLN